MWEVPYICHFSWLFQQCLGVEPLTLNVAEQDIINLKSPNNLVTTLLSRLILEPKERSLLPKKHSLPLDNLDELLKMILDDWFDHQNEEDYTFIMPKPNLSTCFMKENPLCSNKLWNTPLKDRVAIIKMFCDSRQDTDEFRDHLKDIEYFEQRIAPFGQDTLGNKYYYFGFADYRIYIQNVIKKDGIDVVKFRLVSKDVETYKNLMFQLKRSYKVKDRAVYKQLQLLEPELIQAEKERQEKAERLRTRQSSKDFGEWKPLKRSSRLVKKEKERIEREKELFGNIQTPTKPLTAVEKARNLAFDLKRQFIERRSTTNRQLTFNKSRNEVDVSSESDNDNDSTSE